MSSSHEQSDNNSIGCLFVVLFFLLGTGGILFGLPSFIANTPKDRFLEPQNYIGAMNKGQQAYFLEKQMFADSIDVLGIGIKNETENYVYQIVNQQERVINYGISKNDKLRSYVGGVFLVPDTTVTSNNKESKTMTSVAIICQGKDLSIKKLNPPKLENNVPVCAEGTISLY